jgi:hypothetical protein
MNITIGSNTFIEVEIPLLWGSRAVLQDPEQRVSVVNLSEEEAQLEILGDQPAPGVEYLPTHSGFEIIVDGKPLYSYNPDEKLLTSIALGRLPDCQILPNGVIVGTNRFMGNTAIGFGVGLAVSEDSIRFAAPLPKGLAKLQI